MNVLPVCAKCARIPDEIRAFAVGIEDRTRVYVVDDERVIASTICTVLEQAGFEATAFFHPQDLLDRAALQPPDIVLSDVVMPEMNGLELSLRLGMDHPDCKVMLFSGQAETSELLEAARAHGYDFEVLAKPVHPLELVRRLRELALDRHAVPVLTRT